jgi:hypothetical protein
MARPPLMPPAEPSLDPRRRRALPILSLVVAVPLLLPFVIDAALLCYGQWRQMLGTPVDIRTPALDAGRERLAEAREGIWRPISTYLDPAAWDRRLVVVVGVTAVVAAMAVIRR